ncbi:MULTISPECIES: methylation-associated defense system protein MAD7 [Chryseobacterium]|jgi:hypothetical protein|uniref:Uncharacterized protein n=1 Tax=Chryseobacterium urinae TaxID=3058400 RepID=A0ABT8TZG6_9FLAO|nr:MULTISPECIES: hypothetical protein [Chryseobacterium]ATN06664.1 hypothetical protein CRN76_15275 [Chryseobacterium indologenes]AYY84590.1 hypothetical protein EGX91_08525 [Chryseobacterium indologenes]MDO3424200.1 hypothetical protein [Chryseobacterium sp. APV1]
MAIKLNKQESTFRNELLFTADAKTIRIDNTLVNLFMLLKHEGIRPKQRTRRGDSVFIELDKLKNIFQKLEESNELEGFKENPEAVELWLRTNLVNMVNRGNSEKEKISSLRPIHLESYRVRNVPNTRDYFTADQVYLMLGQNPIVKEDLRNFLAEGWDKTTNTLLQSKELDVDSLGILYLIKNVNPGFMESNTTLNKVKPLLIEQAELFCDDVRRLLVYKSKIPRNILIDYLKTITSFHLALYINKVIYLLPKMIEVGTKDVVDDWNIVIDATDDFESKVSSIAIAEAEKTYNSLYKYIKATFKINSIIQKLKLDESNSDSIEKALEVLKNELNQYETKFEAYWDIVYNEQDEDDKDLLAEMVKYETTYFDRYVELLLKVRGKRLQKDHIELLDSLSQKNSERGFLAQGRSKKYPRRYMLGTRLLEALVQIQVLHLEGDKFITQSLSIEELMNNLKERYGLIINGLEEERFQNTDLHTHLAFKENVEAFKIKLRQIGFYNDLSDAYILQKIRPRYELS